MVRPWGNTSMVFFIFLIPTKFVVFSCLKITSVRTGADWSGHRYRSGKGASIFAA